MISHTGRGKHRRAMDVEEAFKVVGAFGKFQALLFLTIAANSIYVAFQMVLMIFVGAEPKLTSSERGKMAGDMESIVYEWNLTGDRQYITTAITSIFMAGVLIGNVAIGQLSDRYGRKPVYFKALILLILTAFATSLTTDWRVFAVFRFFTGIFQGGVVLVGFVLAQELVGSSVWTLTGNFIQALFAIGIIILAGLASVFHNWRHLCVVTSVPGLILLTNYWILPESPRWLYSQGKVSAAEEVLRTLAKKNGVPMTAVNSIILEKKKEEKTHKKSYTLRDLFSSRNMTIRTLIMAYCWFVCSLNYYALTLNAKDLAKSLYVSAALSGLVELPSCIFCAAVLNRVWAGRRRTLIALMIVAGVSCISTMMLANPGEKTTARTVLALTGKFAIASAFSLIYIYASELFPTVVRNVGMGSSSMCARVGGIIAPFVHTLDVYGAAVPYVLYGFVALVAAVLVLKLPETLNQPIPDTLGDVMDERPTEKIRMKRKKKHHLEVSEDKQQLLNEDQENYDNV